MTQSARRLDLLYVNGTSEGGSLMSTRRLLEEVARLGHRVLLLHESPKGAGRRAFYRRATNLEVKIGGAVGRPPLAHVNRLLGAQPAPSRAAEFGQLQSPIVENAARTLVRRERFDVMVASSVSRVAWMRLRQTSTECGLPLVLYLREEALLAHLERGRPDVLLANSEALAASCRRDGWTCAVVPSVIDLDASAVESTGHSAVMINPSAAYGLDIGLAIAAQMPEVAFVLQESTEMTEAVVDLLQGRIASLPNVELRRFTDDPAEIYRDARVLLAPYGVELASNRPRSALEAQANGIPVVGTARPGLIEATGGRGVLLPPDAPVEDWVQVLRELWADESKYQELADEARGWARLAQPPPADIADRFISQLTVATDAR